MTERGEVFIILGSPIRIEYSSPSLRAFSYIPHQQPPRMQNWVYEFGNVFKILSFKEDEFIFTTRWKLINRADFILLKKKINQQGILR